MIRRPPRSTLFPYTTALPIFFGREDEVLNFSATSLKVFFNCCHSEAGRMMQAYSFSSSIRHGFLLHFLLHSRFFRNFFGQELMRDRKSTRLNSSHANISYAVF